MADTTNIPADNSKHDDLNPAVLIVHLVLSQVAVHVVLNLKMIKWHHG